MLNDHNLAQIQRFCDELRVYNAHTNIYSKKSYDHLPYHTEDSIQLAGLVNHGGIHVDIGSGSGFPGVIIALLTEATVICVESKSRKRRFLQHIQTTLGIRNLIVFEGDFQLFATTYRKKARIQTFSAKAFAKPPALLAALAGVNPGRYAPDAVCWVPISVNQKPFLEPYDTVVSVTSPRTGEVFWYFRIRMAAFRSYKADLKTQYTL